MKRGKLLSLTKSHLNCTGNKRSRYINMTKTKGRRVFITAVKSQCVECIPNTHILGTTLTLKNKVDCMSGIVVLMMAVISKHDVRELWTNDIYDIARKCKNNSLQSYSHHETKGYNYSFGNKAFYGNDKGSSISIYTNKKNRTEAIQDTIDADAIYVNHICNRALHWGMLEIRKVFPEIKLLLSPILNAAFDKQCGNGTKLLQPVDSSDDGCWNSFLFIDTRTESFHRENDCAYTMITVPNQHMDREKHPSQQPAFIFKINEQQNITLPLTSDVTFFYNASFLTHRQSYTPTETKDSHKFFNISSYANEKIFNHLLLSFERSNNLF